MALIRQFKRPIPHTPTQTIIGWHVHACKDCGKSFPCHLGHAPTDTGKHHRCEACFERYDQGAR